MKPRLAIIGYGLLGRLLAWQASRLGFAVEVFERGKTEDRDQACFAAGGMLAPFSELEQSEDLIFHLGLAGLKIWPRWVAELGCELGFWQRGSLIVAHPRDRMLWLNFKQKTCRLAQAGQYQDCQAQAVEPELHPSLLEGLFFPDEQHIDPTSLLERLDQENSKLGVQVFFQQSRNHADCKEEFSQKYQWIVDCRGIGAKGDLQDLRGVRGEALLVKAPDVRLTRPIRLLHPRYSLYIVPRQNQIYYLGATQIESESLAPITVRSSLELLSAAFAVHTGFAEGQVLKSLVGLRPAFSHNKPQIIVKGRWISLNGLFRHGYLLGPMLIESVLTYMQGAQIDGISSELFVQQEIDT